MSRRAVPVLAGALALVTGCHTTRSFEITRVGRTAIVPRSGPPRVLPTTIVVDEGRLRFVSPLRCASDVVVDLDTERVVQVRPNLAAFVVGITASSLGALGLFLGATSDEPGSSPLTYGGGALLGVGAPLMIGPWLGDHDEHHDAGTRSERRGTRDQPCGQRGVAGRAAVVDTAGLRLVGDVDGDGFFAVSPYQIIDAFEPTAPGLDLTATLDGAAVRAVVPAGDLAAGRAAFLAAQHLDADAPPTRKVPHLEPGPLRVSRVSLGGGPAVKVVLAVGNSGPGDAHAVRGRVTISPGPAPASAAGASGAADLARELDRRLLYLGTIGARRTVTGEVVVPISDAADRALAAARLEIAVELREASGAAPDRPVSFRGPVASESR